MHVFYKHSQVNVDGWDSTPKSYVVLMDYHFYINDDHEYNMLFVPHYFVLNYESFKNNKIK
jgi:hypothetical protein